MQVVINTKMHRKKDISHQNYGFFGLSNTAKCIVLNWSTFITLCKLYFSHCDDVLVEIVVRSNRDAPDQA